MDTEVKRPIERRETMIIITDDDHICCYQATFDSRRIKVYHRFIETDTENTFMARCINCGFVSFIRR